MFDYTKPYKDEHIHWDVYFSSYSIDKSITKYIAYHIILVCLIKECFEMNHSKYKFIQIK